MTKDKTLDEVADTLKRLLPECSVTKEFFGKSLCVANKQAVALATIRLGNPVMVEFHTARTIKPFVFDTTDEAVSKVVKSCEQRISRDGQRAAKQLERMNQKRRKLYYDTYGIELEE